MCYKQFIMGMMALFVVEINYADTLQVCNKAAVPYLQWESKDNSCQSLVTHVAKENLKWSSITTIGAKIPDRLVIEGGVNNSQFIPNRVTLDYNQSATNNVATTPFTADILAAFEAKAFGSEERATISDHVDSISLNCKAGEKAAGIILSPKYYKIIDGIEQNILIQGKAQGAFQFSLLDKGQDARTTGAVLDNNGTIILSLDTTHGAANDKQITILCPTTNASLAINSIKVKPKPQVMTSNLQLSTWIWDFKVWQKDPNKLLSWAKSKGLNKLYIQVEITDNQINKPHQLRELLKNAHKQAIKIVIVEGDPNMIQGDGLVYALSRTKTLAEFQNKLPANEKFAGIQYDIEPYILADFELNSALLFKHWANAIQQLSKAWGSSVELAVPFWLLENNGGKEALTQLRSVTSTLVIMAYRTDEQLILNSSIPLLNWGLQNKVAIVVALENGPIPDQINRTYIRTEQDGEVEYIPQENYSVVLLAKEKINSAPYLYKYSHEVKVPGSRISYLGDTAKLLAAKQHLTPILTAWSSFVGFALHEFDTQQLK